MRPPFSGSSPTLMSPTDGRSTPWIFSMKRVAMRANWRMLCSSASIVAPDEHEVRWTALFPIQQSAPDDLVRGVVAAHRVDGDLHQSTAVLRPASEWP